MAIHISKQLVPTPDSITGAMLNAALSVAIGDTAQRLLQRGPSIDPRSVYIRVDDHQDGYEVVATAWDE